MGSKEEKRELPTMLRKILAIDVQLTEEFVKHAEKIVAFRQIQVHSRALEITCHGIPWLACWMAFIWIINSKSLYQMQVNLFIGLILDIIIIAVIKSLARRRRPTVNSDPLGIGPDKYSFPSGHASRATFITYFFIHQGYCHYLYIPSLLAWSTSVCLSRILARKHFILDVLVGVVLGITLGMFISFIYLSEETCTSIIHWMTDEKLDGGEYHV